MDKGLSDLKPHQPSSGSSSSGFSSNVVMAAAKDKDIEDAILTAWQSAGGGVSDDFPVFPSEDFEQHDLGQVSLDDLGSFDDFSSWVEFEPGELQGESEGDIMEALTSYRDTSFAKRAMGWIKSDKFPPVIVITFPDENDIGTMIGDGRGRINVATAMGIDKLPTIYLKHKDDDHSIEQVKNQIKASLNRIVNQKVLIAALKIVAKDLITTPKPLADYIMGHDSAVSQEDLPEGYYDEIQAVIPKKPITVYRAFDWPDKLTKEDTKAGGRFNPFNGDIPLLSFTASKETALAIAKEKSEDYEDVYIYAISMKVEPGAVYFHYKYNDIGREHPKEKEVTIDASDEGFKILKEYPPT